MATPKILAFSSSRVGNGNYLETAVPEIKSLLGGGPINIAFVPFAGVTIGYDDYTKNVKDALAGLPYNIEVVLPENAQATIEKADAIMIGGGNTFKLLSMVYNTQVLDAIRNKVNTGTPYIGWSAGSNITGPTIATTNDMPIVEPKSFHALGFFPFQINPHYYNVKPEGFNGETRDQRLTEFLIENPSMAVVCLPEGTALKLENNTLKLIGKCAGVVLAIKAGEHEVVRTAINAGDDITWLM